MEMDKNLVTALLKAVDEFPPLVKDSRGHGYKYMTLDSLLNGVRPALTANGLLVSWTHEPCEGGVITTCRLIHAGGGTLTCSTPPMPVAKSGRNSPAQEVGSVLTYGRRYSLSSVLGLGTGEDDDAAGGRQGGQQRPAQGQQERQKAVREMVGNPFGVNVQNDLEDDIPF